MPKLDVLVAGVTGRQGGAVARALLQGGHDVRALTSNLVHPAVDALRQRGARLAWASLDDEPALLEVADGVDAIFAVTTSHPHGTAVEAHHGVMLAEVARRLGVKHFVFSSLPSAHAESTEPGVAAKYEVEQYLRATGVPHTVVCPTWFMENLLNPSMLRHVRAGRLPLPLAPGQTLQQLAHADLGRFVRMLLEQRDEWVGRRICIAADELTPLAMAAVLARATGRSMVHEQVAAGLWEQGEPDARPLIDLARLRGPAADVAALRRDYPDVGWHSLDGWAAGQQWNAPGPDLAPSE